jgi:hypothetical protein
VVGCTNRYHVTLLLSHQQALTSPPLPLRATAPLPPLPRPPRLRLPTVTLPAAEDSSAAALPVTTTRYNSTTHDKTRKTNRVFAVIAYTLACVAHLDTYFLSV